MLVLLLQYAYANWNESLLQAREYGVPIRSVTFSGLMCLTCDLVSSGMPSIAPVHTYGLGVLMLFAALCASLECSVSFHWKC